MDPRQERTWQRLRGAARERFAATPLTQVTVSVLARDAGVSRDTFYRHADGPGDLLARVLGEDLDAVMRAFETFDGTAKDRFDVAERALFRHLHADRVLYRSAMDPWLAEPVRAMLLERIGTALATFLDAHPDVPPRQSGMEIAESNRLYIAYGAAGTVGAIDLWLRDGAVNPDAAARAVLAVSAPWWTR